MEFSINEYVRDRGIELAKTLDSRRAIYLDLRFWIIARNVNLGRNTDAASIDFLNLLRTQVHAGQIFCPISETVFGELMKQSDVVTRIATVELIDELSLGVALVLEPQRVTRELEHFLLPAPSTGSRNPVHWLVWTKLCYVLGVFHPTKKG